MSNDLNPPKIIFINNNLSSGVLSRIEKQLDISETISKEVFDGYYAYDNLYPKEQRSLDKKILVLCDLKTITDRSLADIVLCYKHGLIYIEESKYGPPGKSLSLDNVYIRTLLI